MPRRPAAAAKVDSSLIISTKRKSSKPSYFNNGDYVMEKVAKKARVSA